MCINTRSNTRHCFLLLVRVPNVVAASSDHHPAKLNCGIHSKSLLPSYRSSTDEKLISQLSIIPILLVLLWGSFPSLLSPHPWVSSCLYIGCIILCPCQRNCYWLYNANWHKHRIHHHLPHSRARLNEQAQKNYPIPVTYWTVHARNLTLVSQASPSGLYICKFG